MLPLRSRALLLLPSLLAACALPGRHAVESGALSQDADPSRYDLVWTTPSADASGSMPLGNGEVALNAWMDTDGTLSFYLARTDAWSDNGRLLKVGRLRVRTEPPLDPSAGFEQRLDLEAGALVIDCGPEGDRSRLRLWVDAHAPIVQVEIDGDRPRAAVAEIDLWRTARERYPLAEVSDLLEDRSQPDKLHEPVWVEPDTVIEGLADGIGWYHYNRKSVGPAMMHERQGLAGYFEDQPDPLLHRIFGALVGAGGAPGAERLDDQRLRSPAARAHRFSVVVHAAHPSDPEAWVAEARAIEAEAAARPFAARRDAHEAWWREFWGRSWIHLEQTAATDPVPRNAHPVRIGVDQHGHNRFVGELGALTIRSGDSADDPRFASDAAAIGPIADSAAWSFEDGFRFEARLKPGALPAGGGRIVDKTTPGASDGLLFDTYPGHSLRLIVGSRILSAPDVLPRDRWVVVAATLDAATGAMALFVDGEQVAASAGQADHDGPALDDAATVARAYALQRWVDACAGRGRYPIKFNGSLFTVPHEGKFGDADYRRWGPGYWWQNTRLPYLSMCASGDFEMLRPLFRLYAEDTMPVHVYRTRQYTGHGGAFVPEVMNFWGPTFTATYGWTPFAERGEDKLQESPWHKWEWVSGLELVWMMLDWYEHTEDQAFARELLLPTAREILLFFEQHSPLDDAGKLVMHPSQALETWWDCTNPLPEVAGLQAVTARLLALPDSLGSEEERAFWRHVQAITPELPTWEKDGKRLLAPAERFEAKSNVENPELYAVFPFRLVSFEKDNAALGLRALDHRWDRGDFGWRQDDLFMTHLGLADDARANLVRRARNKHAGSRFPVFWGPNYDWIPDQDHGGVLMRTLQTMLMQTEGRTIHLLPAWPEGWDADFQLHAPYRTTITAKVRDGELLDLVVEPPSRRADVIVRGSLAGP